MNVTENQNKLRLPEVFIVGSGRSGTTLLSSILNASEQIFVPYESDFIARAHPFFSSFKSFCTEDYLLISDLFKITSKQEGWDLDRDEIISCLENASPQSFNAVNSEIYKCFHRKEGTQDLLWGIKSPVLIASLERIYNVCPNTKLIHVVRDGRDVCVSYRKIHTTSEIVFGPKGIVENALYWVDGLRRIEKFMKNNSHRSVYEIRFANLLSNPGSELSKLCSFMNIQYRASMHEQFNQCDRNQKVAPDQFRQSIHKKLSGSLDSGNTNKYLSELTSYQLAIYELIAAPYLLKYGYKLRYEILGTSLLNPIRWFLYSLARRFNDWRYDRRDRQMYAEAASRQHF